MAVDNPARVAWDQAQRANERGQPEEAARWLERAHRLVPGDALVALTFGSQLLACGEAARAAALLGKLAATVPDAAVAWAAAELMRGDREAAVQALASVLRQLVVTAAVAGLADRVGVPWCGLGPDRRLLFGGGAEAEAWLDGQAFDRDRVVESGETMVVRGAEGSLLGSPLPVRRLRALQGFVESGPNGIVGWAWHPADPDREPEIVVQGPRGARTFTLLAAAEGVEDLPVLARPRRLALTMAELDEIGEPVAITDEAGNHLLGSPVWRAPAPSPAPFAPPRGVAERRAVDVVVPVYGNVAETLGCLQSVLASVPAGSVVHVVDDGSPEPELVAALGAMEGIVLHQHAANRGFPGAANTGIRAAAGRDVVLLNSDTVVPPGWLERLRDAAYSAPDVGTATPLSTDDSIVGYGGIGSAAALDGVAQTVNAGMTAPLPVGVGFCLYIRRDCLDQVGALREELFAQGYGEESEFCLRARRCGWRHVAALDVLVAHAGGMSFGMGRAALRARNQALLERHFPEYTGLIAAHEAANPLFAARRRMDTAAWAAGRLGASVVLVSHGAGGGVDEMVAARAAALRKQGVRPVVIVPAVGGCRVEGFGDLRFAVPSELPALAELLREDRPAQLEVHHLLGHDHAVLGLAGLLGIPVDHWVHDAASFCPRVALIGRGRRYCGEPALAGCEACVGALGSNLAEPIGPTALVARSAADLVGSRRVVVPTADTGRRIGRHFPGIHPVVSPWEDDRALPPLETTANGVVTRVCVVGAIGVEKGYDVLLACAADARERALPLEFVVCGRTEDDARLMAAGPVFVTGRYAADEAVALIRRQAAQLAFIPSIWPETWCFALSRAWQAGLAAVAFDLGAPAERIRNTGCQEMGRPEMERQEMGPQKMGRGHVLPLGLPAAGVNDALLRLATARVVRLQPSRAIRSDRPACQTKPAPVP